MNKAKYRLAALLLLVLMLGSRSALAAPIDQLAARISGGAATVALAALLRGDDRLLQLQIVSRKESHAGLVSFSVDRSVGQAAAQARGLRFVGWGLLVEGQAACRLAVQPPAVQLRSRCEAGWIVREWDATPLVGSGVSFSLSEQRTVQATAATTAQTTGTQPRPTPTSIPVLSPTARAVTPTPTATILTPTTTLTAEPTNQLVPTQVPSTVEPTILASPTASTSITITPTATATTAAVMLADTRPYIEQPPVSVTAMVGLPVEMNVWTPTPRPELTTTSQPSTTVATVEPTPDPGIMGWLQANFWVPVVLVSTVLLAASGWLLVYKKIINPKKLQTFIAKLKQRTGGQAQP